MNTLTAQSLSTIKVAAKKLSGSKRRAFQAQVTKDYLGGSGRRAERVFGWSRTTVEKGVRESRTTRRAGGLRKAPKRGYLVKQVLLAIEVFLILHVSTDHLLV